MKILINSYCTKLYNLLIKKYMNIDYFNTHFMNGATFSPPPFGIQTVKLETMHRTPLELNTMIKTSEELIDVLSENFKLKFNKDPYYFSGISCAAIIKSDGTMEPGFTDEEKLALKITREKVRIEQLEEAKEVLHKIEKLRKYIDRYGLTIQDLVEAFPDDLERKVSNIDYDEDYD
jgi:hypothetical protein